jgi:hypothetical protein
MCCPIKKFTAQGLHLFYRSGMGYAMQSAPRVRCLAFAAEAPLRGEMSIVQALCVAQPTHTAL